jgi:hypothetical protein
MTTPPHQLDGADVLLWTVSQRGGFYVLAGSDPPVTVTAMVVARYADGGEVYLFKCDGGWDVVQDWDCLSVEEAQALAAEHSCGEALTWQTHARGFPPSSSRGQ